jgi:hypothetical protein
MYIPSSSSVVVLKKVEVMTGVVGVVSVNTSFTISIIIITQYHNYISVLKLMRGFKINYQKYEVD